MLVLSIAENIPQVENSLFAIERPTIVSNRS